MSRYITQHRRGTTAEWKENANVVPYAGEIVIEFCDNGNYKLKIGDGTTTYANLRYMSVDDFVKPGTVTISLLAANWVGTESPYYQVISAQSGSGSTATYSINGVSITSNSKIDLQPTPEQLIAFHDKDVTFVTENNNGTVKVYAIGVKPQNDYIIQSTITEVVV